MFKKMPVILLAVIILAWMANDWIPYELKSMFYAMSLTLKSAIVFVLPIIIFGLLFKTASQMAGKASKIIFFILIGICISNFTSTMLSYGVGTVAYQLDLSMNLAEMQGSLIPAWDFALPKWIPNEYAMFSGLILGILMGCWKPALAHVISGRLQNVVNLILKGILYVIPLFITGFIVKMNHDQLMGTLLRNYTLIFGLIVGAVFSYIALIYFAVNRFQVSATLKSISNMLPAAIAGFGSMSSAAVMPLTILGTEKNSDNPELVRSVIPMTVNVHLMGDCFSIPIFAFAVMKSFGFEEPTFVAYLTFAIYFVLAKFSVAAVPGGGILVMLPLLESILGFNGEMLSLMTTLYILFDPVTTSANVFGNGGFALVMGKLLSTGPSEEAAESIA